MDIDIGRKLDKGNELLIDIKSDTSALTEIKRATSALPEIKIGIHDLNTRFDSYAMRLEKILEKLVESNQESNQKR